MLHKLEAVKPRQILRVCLSFQVYAIKSGVIQKIVLHVSRKRDFIVAWLSVLRFLQLTLDNIHSKAMIWNEMSVRIAFRGQIFSRAGLFFTWKADGRIDIPQITVNYALACMMAWRLPKLWHAFTTVCLTEPLLATKEIRMWFSPDMIFFQILSQWSTALCCWSIEKPFWKPSSTGESQWLDVAARSTSSEVNEEICIPYYYLTKM